MTDFTMPVQIRWADIDQNRHMRHSVYYDYGAMMRMHVLYSQGLTTQKLEELKIGPILFREEALFKREIKLEDQVTITVELLKSTKDYSRWSLRHQFIKADGTLAAILNLDGAWIDMEKRKLAIPNEFVQHVFEKFPKSPEFEWK
ncbi:acyl-CoA thioesterase [Pseudochryseolinea flava]|uniref:Thioesterase n=1 Tax=Pseudochryseolinea flava TaxID=2059302 RepID=A0A364YAD1_9BACT|nr:acyl-CoA thioesterase [Pseudochryseolinea flava]RAW02828.1 thioesterase [Pseudochryseolinea flava]